MPFNLKETRHAASHAIEKSILVENQYYKYLLMQKYFAFFVAIFLAATTIVDYTPVLMFAIYDVVVERRKYQLKAKWYADRKRGLLSEKTSKYISWTISIFLIAFSSPVIFQFLSNYCYSKLSIFPSSFLLALSRLIDNLASNDFALYPNYLESIFQNSIFSAQNFLFLRLVLIVILAQLNLVLALRFSFSPSAQYVRRLPFTSDFEKNSQILKDQINRALRNNALIFLVLLLSAYVFSFKFQADVGNSPLSIKNPVNLIVAQTFMYLGILSGQWSLVGTIAEAVLKKNN